LRLRAASARSGGGTAASNIGRSRRDPAGGIRKTPWLVGRAVRTLIKRTLVRFLSSRTTDTQGAVMSGLLHISSSPRGDASESLAVAQSFLDAYRESHPGSEIRVWDLWDGSLPAFGPPAAAAKMAVFAGQQPRGEEAAAWQAALHAFARFNAFDHYLFSVPMWNATIPYILKQIGRASCRERV